MNTIIIIFSINHLLQRIYIGLHSILGALLTTSQLGTISEITSCRILILRRALRLLWGHILSSHSHYIAYYKWCYWLQNSKVKIPTPNETCIALAVKPILPCNCVDNDFIWRSSITDFTMRTCTCTCVLRVPLNTYIGELTSKHTQIRNSHVGPYDINITGIWRVTATWPNGGTLLHPWWCFNCCSCSVPRW